MPAMEFPPQALASTPPPPPLPAVDAGKGLSFSEVAALIKRSQFGVSEAVKRLGLEWLDFKHVRLLSPE